MGCVYLATHIESGRVYIGQTNHTADFRWKSHVYRAKYRPHCAVDKAIAEYGPESFILQELSSHASKLELDNAERVAIMVFSSTDNRFGFNARRGGSRGAHTALTIAKMSAAKKMQSAETRAKISISNRGNTSSRGRILSEQHKMRIGMAHKGRPRSEEYRSKISATLKNHFQLKANREVK